ncbi:TIGR00730 family Rossman fold protein [Candidatus Chlorohelix sp.]|uniref:LOG family protein n=1 Tax=Candidatus Chlorohelix sp. TaxID=3139201 RepID=UPI0030208748
MHKPIHIAVYCASSNAIAPHYFEVATQLGEMMAARGAVLVYGGGRIGLMGAVSQAMFKNGGSVIGVIPYFLERIEIGNHDAGELILTDGMRERKAIMEERADAFITLPGGFGTLEEIFEILTGGQLGVHQKPMVLVNTNGFYNHLLAQLKLGVEEHFIKAAHMELLHVANTPQEALDYIFNYQPHQHIKKVTEAELKNSEKNGNGETPGAE